MSKMRSIDTRFYDDNYIVKLDPVEKNIFLYLLINPLVETGGIYEISTRRISYDTGYTQEVVDQVLPRFAEAGKMLHIDGWLFIRNYIKYQADNVNINKGIKRVAMSIPQSVLSKVSEISPIWMEATYKRLQMTPSDLVVASSDLKCPQRDVESFPLILTLTPAPYGEKKQSFGVASPPGGIEVFSEEEKPLVKKTDQEPEKKENVINKLFGIFYEYHPGVKFGNPRQREAAEKIIKSEGEDRALELARFAISIQGEKGAPEIADPLTMFNKLGYLKTWKLKKEKQETANDYDQNMEAVINNLRNGK